jgi:hypothetical protein
MLGALGDNVPPPPDVSNEAASMKELSVPNGEGSACQHRRRSCLGEKAKLKVSSMMNMQMHDAAWASGTNEKE